MSLRCCRKPSRKIAFRNVTNISDSLINVVESESIPSEFNRKPRSVTEIRWWKNSVKLFYTGPVGLKKLLVKAKYLNFISSHVASTILMNHILLIMHTRLQYSSPKLETKIYLKLYNRIVHIAKCILPKLIFHLWYIWQVNYDKLTS